MAECTLAPEVRSQNTEYEINRAYGLIRLPRRYFFQAGFVLGHPEFNFSAFMLL